MAQRKPCQQESDHTIKEESVTEQKNSLAVCLDNILRHAGITRNTEYDLAQGKTATTILSENMTGVQVLDLSGCTLDAVLYYVNQDIRYWRSWRTGKQCW